MPIYVYQCENCDDKFSVHARMKEVIQVSCPRCGGSDVRRIPQPFAYHVQITDTGQRKAREIYHYLKNKRDPARAEAERETYEKERRYGNQ